MSGFLLAREESLLFVKNESFTVNRPIHSLETVETLDPSVKTAMLALSKWKVGKKYWAKEYFRIKNDIDRDQFWVIYECDNTIARGSQIHGQSGMKDGLYTAMTMREWMSRSKIEITGVDIIRDRYAQTTGRFRYQFTGWVWAISFKKVSE